MFIHRMVITEDIPDDVVLSQTLRIHLSYLYIPPNTSKLYLEGNNEIALNPDSHLLPLQIAKLGLEDFS